jgi:pimeloyl-ACP methyl ester carboxylesterase
MNAPRRVAGQLVAVVSAVCLGMVASCGSPSAPGAKSAPVNTLTVKSCTVDGYVAARCGTLVVPENRLTGQGRTIAVRFVVIPATGPGPRTADPVVWFAGGPGDSAVNSIPGEYPLIMDLNTSRDLVFIEQRGTGSSNPLNCPDFAGSLSDNAALRQSVESCLASLHGDLRYYTTTMFTDDVSQVLTALHYGPANLIGISYGTAAAQVFALQHPAQVRTMTLLSGSPLTVPLLERAPGNSQLALDYVFSLCEMQAACQMRFPHLAADWAALWSSLGQSPIVIPAAQAPTKKTAVIGQEEIQAAVYQMLYTGYVNSLPLVVHTLATASDKAAALLALNRAYQASPLPPLGNGLNQMMYYAINCGDPWFSFRPAALAGQRDSFEYRTDLASAQWQQYVCTLIPKSAAAIGHVQLTASTIPVLAFNGAMDPIEQPRNMARVKQLWPNSLAVTVPGQGHDVWSSAWDPCGAGLFKKFVGQASVAGLNTGCTSAVPQPDFDLILP